MTAASKKARKRPARAKAKGMSHGPIAMPWLLAAVAAAYAGIVLPDLGPDRGVAWPALVPLGVYVACVLASQVILGLTGFKGDKTLLWHAFFLAGLGVITQFRLGSYDMENVMAPANCAFPAGVAVSLATCLILANGRHKALRPLWFMALLLATLVMALVLVFGRRYRGAMFLPGNINPVEIAKLLLVVFLAGFLAPHRKTLQRSTAGLPMPSFGFVITFAVFWAAPMGLLVLQRDLGMIVLLNATLMTMVLVLSGRWGYLFWGAVLVTGLCLAAFFLVGHSHSRFVTWLWPFRDPTGASWQLLQGLSAMYTGGLWGSGLGAGAPSSIPIASSDLVYAALGEELGFIGCGTVIVGWIGLLSRAFHVAESQRDDYGRMLASGLASILGLQAFLNIGGVVKLIPLTGITLPFISHGGSSLMTSFAIVGLLAAMSTPPTPPRKRTNARGHHDEP